MNTYLDCFDFLRSTSGLETQSLIGNAARFTSAQAQSATSLSVPTSGIGSLTVALNQFDRITIFDGSNSETVRVGAGGAAVAATTVPLMDALQFPHAVGVAWCSDGFAGSLADQISAASAWIETQCYQPLLSTTWANEAIGMPSLRASFANDGGLTFRPRHWPVSSVTALKIAVTQTLATTYDATQVFVDGNRRLCSVPNLIQFPAQQSSNSIPPPPSRSQSAQLILTYQAGYAYSALPADVKEAAILITAELISKRHNPVGAPDLADGASRISVVLRGDLSGESILVKKAIKILSHYSLELW